MHNRPGKQRGRRREGGPAAHAHTVPGVAAPAASGPAALASARAPRGHLLPLAEAKPPRRSVPAQPEAPRTRIRPGPPPKAGSSSAAGSGSIPWSFRQRKTWRKREGIDRMGLGGPRHRPWRPPRPPAALAGSRFSFLLGRRRARVRFPELPMGKDWRKREGIEPPGGVSASRPDLKSGGATSAPSASVARNAPPPGGAVSFCPRFSAPSGAASATFPSSSAGAGSRASVRSPSSLESFLFRNFATLGAL
jgi:hypothetical protein